MFCICTSILIVFFDAFFFTVINIQLKLLKTCFIVVLLIFSFLFLVKWLQSKPNRYKQRCSLQRPAGE